jgi:cytidine deaminase
MKKLSGSIPWKRLAKAARAAHRRAYAPYSRFRVGAAVLTEKGSIFSGCNVENASYGLSICAERNAIFQAIASGAREVRAMALYTPTPRPTAPCGACRQVLREFGLSAQVQSCCASTEELICTAADLLPNSFGPDSLHL